MRTDIIEKAAYKMFEYEFTNLGYEVEWCKSMFSEAGKLHARVYECAHAPLLGTHCDSSPAC